MSRACNIGRSRTLTENPKTRILYHNKMLFPSKRMLFENASTKINQHVPAFIRVNRHFTTMLMRVIEEDENLRFKEEEDETEEARSHFCV